jgi:hypothetical protein
MIKIPLVLDELSHEELINLAMRPTSVVDDLVYVTSHGKCYHTQQCKYNMYGKAMKRSEAEAKHKRRCGACQP